MKLSIVTPTYGRAEKLVSIVKAFNVNYIEGIELIIVDDNGLGTLEQAKTQRVLLPHLNDNVKYLALEYNSGAGLARNAGVELAKGTYITFLDDDDELVYDISLNKLQFALDNDLDLICSDMFYRKGGLFVENKRSKFLGVDAKEFLLNGNCWTPMIMLKKSLFNSLGGFEDTPYFQDHTFMLKVHLANIVVSYFPHKTFIHNDHSGKRITGKRVNSKGIATRLFYELRLKEMITLSRVENKMFNFEVNRSEFFIAKIDKNLSFPKVLNYSRKQLYCANSMLDLARVLKDIVSGCSLLLGKR
ncbi:glycosyltransferase [Vibrio parahaemolyticus]|uniref:glycosyltransferase family 2 protein n=1 Tax=Vibrio parahaemolyticus TaxID=670 RepID=UPI00215C48EB|nr:glycosyltransferase family 2 protein [Vibrio parahaemolyticus]MCS0049300.1 glycosyltransferase [Vibrio parahaemolyticus]